MAAEDNIKFQQALDEGRCDIVDSMIEAGYIPETHIIVDVCREGNLDLLNTLLRYFDNVGKEMAELVKLQESQQQIESEESEELEESEDLCNEFRSTLKQSLQDGFIAAVEHGHVQLLDHLYLLGVDINLPSALRNTALHRTADLHTCKWLLDMGGRQTTNHNGQTPVHVACSSRSNEVLKLLLQYPEGRESLTKYNNSGNTPMLIACDYMRSVTVEAILQYPEGRQSLTLCDKNGNTPLIVACRYGMLDMVQAILQYPEGRQTINKPNHQGKTPLNLARPYGDNETIKLLLQYS